MTSTDPTAKHIKEKFDTEASPRGAVQRRSTIRRNRRSRSWQDHTNASGHRTHASEESTKLDQAHGPSDY
jgi:hypothetical protein